jgi:hypothetical protein
MKGLGDLLAAAIEVTRLCEGLGYRFCFIGGLAVQRWGNPRFTADIDLTVITGFGGEEAYLDALLMQLQPRRADARSFALTHRVLLARTAGGVDVDIALGGLPFEERTVQRATRWKLEGGHELLTCSAEDLIVHKVFAGRDRDWDDVRGIIARRNDALDWNVVREELPPLLELKESAESMQRLEALAAEALRRRSRKR